MARHIFNRSQGVWFIAPLVACIIALSAWLSSSALAASAKEIDAGVDEAIVKFEKEVKGGKSFLDSSKGMLVFPRVLKGGAGFGGEYGEGALRVAGKTADYYSMLQGSFGLQLGGEIKTVFLVFLDEAALKGFPAKRRLESGSGWFRLPGHLGSRGHHRYAKLERPDRRLRLRSERADVQPVARRNEIYKAE